MTRDYTELAGTAALAYAEVLDNALAKDISVGEGFSFISAMRKGNKYWYLQHTLPVPTKQYYLGAESSDLLQRIEEQKARWAAGKVDAKVLERQVAMALAAGCTGITYQAYRVLNAAAESGLFKAGGVMVGSYAFAAFGNMLGVSWVRNSTITQDIDLAGSAKCMVALPAGVQPLSEVILNSDKHMLEVPMFDRKSPNTRFHIRGKEFRVELLTPMKGRPKSSQFVEGMQSYAEPIAFLEYLLEDTQKAVLLYRSGVVVNVPSPARFAIHKLMVSLRRHSTEQTKSRKDLLQASQLISCLLDQRPGDLWLAMDAVKAHPSKKFRDTVKKGIAKLDKELREPLEESW